MRSWLLSAYGAFAARVVTEGSNLVPFTNKWYTASKYEYDPLTRYANESDAQPQLIIKALEIAAATNPHAIALRQPIMDKSGNLIEHKKTKKREPGGKYQYRDFTWKQYHDVVLDVAAAFTKMGLKPMDSVHIRGVNSPEWLITYFGCIAAGGLPVGLYPTDSPDALEFKAKDSGAVFVVVGKVRDLNAYSQFVGDVKTLKAVVYWDLNPQYPSQIDKDVVAKLETNNRKLLHWDDFINIGKTATAERAEVVKGVDEQKPGQAGSVVYTSGTTGNPKGVMLSQDALTWTMQNVIAFMYGTNTTEGDKVSKVPRPNPHQRVVSYLPLNHIAGQELDMLFPVGWTGKEGQVATIYFPAICFLKKTCFVEQLVDAKPTNFLGVPAVWNGLKAKIEVASRRGLKRLVAKLKPSVILKKLGLGSLDIAVSGAGPISKETLTFFHNMGINILNVYGQSESSAIGTAWLNRDFYRYSNFKSKFGSIGRALGIRVRIANPDSEGRGEIQLRGRNLMMGYLNNLPKTKGAFASDGWLMTGDQGKIDEDGFVHLTGRIKEIMKDLGGEMILPVQVEEGIKKACNKPLKAIINEVVVVGDGQYFISALITLMEEKPENIPDGKLFGYAKHVDSSATTVLEAKKSDAWAKELSTCIGEYNKVAAKSQERVFRYYILPQDITAEDSPDLMTPTQKIKRTGIVAKYAKEITSCGADKQLIERKVEPCTSE